MIAAVRGRGLLVGVEVTVMARPIAEAMMRLGVLVKDTHGQVLRLTPPLTVTEDHLDLIVSALNRALNQTRADNTPE
jgi:ornithine--oxo-acid transaminase